jgi:hypothetical protein
VALDHRLSQDIHASLSIDVRGDKVIAGRTLEFRENVSRNDSQSAIVSYFDSPGEQ